MGKIRHGLLSVTYGGLWFKGEPLSIVDQIKKIRGMGIDGIAIEARRPVASPIDLTKEDRKKIKQAAKTHGVTICAIESMGNFTRLTREERENNLAMMKLILDMAVDLEATTVKVLAEWTGTTLDSKGIATYEIAAAHYGTRSDMTTLDRWRLARDGMGEVSAWAKERGLDLALQNLSPIFSVGYEDALAMVEEIGMDNFKLDMDPHCFGSKQSDEYIKEAFERCQDRLAPFCHYPAWSIGETAPGEIAPIPVNLPCQASVFFTVNYEAFVREAKRIGWDGYMCVEECAPVVVDHEYAGIDEVDRVVTRAVEYIDSILQG
jgi:sugar phosphate isomerase/epimerase